MSERRALPHRSFARGLARLESAPRLPLAWVPPSQARSGAPCPARPPRCPRRRLRAVTPISGPRACSLRRRRAWARAPERALGPGARTAPGKALTLHRAREALALAGRVHGRRLGGPRPAGVPGWGALIYMVQALFLLFFHTPQPSFSQLRQAGRTDVKQAPLPLPRGRWPGPAAPAWLCISGSRGKLRANPDARAARPGSAESPGIWTAHQRPGGLGDRGRRRMRPHPRLPPPPGPNPCGLGRGSLASPARSLLHLPPWASLPDHGGALQRGPRQAAVGGWVRGARRAGEKPQLSVSARQISEALGGSPAQLVKYRGP